MLDLDIFLMVLHELFMRVQSKTKELHHYYEISTTRDTIETKPKIKKKTVMSCFTTRGIRVARAYVTIIVC